MATVYITSKKVKTRKCPNCIYNYSLEYLDNPTNDGLDGWPCKKCYIDRIEKEEDLVVARYRAIESAIRYYEDEYTDLIIHSGKYEYCMLALEKHKLRHDLNDKIKEIMKCKDESALKTMREKLDEKYFNKREDAK